MRLLATIIASFASTVAIAAADPAPSVSVTEGAACVIDSLSQSDRDAYIDSLKTRIPTPLTTAEQQAATKQHVRQQLDVCLKGDRSTTERKNAVIFLVTANIALPFIDSELVHMGVPAGFVETIYADIPPNDRAKLMTGEKLPSVDEAASRHIEQVEQQLMSNEGRKGAGRYYSGFKTGYLVRQGLGYLQMREDALLML